MMPFGSNGMAAWMSGWRWLEMTAMMLVALAIVVLIVVVLIRLGRFGLPSERALPDRSEALLRERYARGEISEEEYRQAQHVLHEESHA